MNWQFSEDYLSQTLRRYIDTESRVVGSASEILASLNHAEGFQAGVKPPLGWPLNPLKMGNTLRRIAPALRALGYSATELSRTGTKRAWHFAVPAKSGHGPSQSSQPSFSVSGPLTGGDGTCDDPGFKANSLVIVGRHDFQPKHRGE